MNYNIRSQFLEEVLTITPNYKNPFDDLLHKELYLTLIQTTNTEMIELQYTIKEICDEQ
jgi:hypothetical protein